MRVALFLVPAGLFTASLSSIVRHADTLFYAAELQLPKSDAEFKDAILVQLTIATATLDYDSIIIEALGRGRYCPRRNLPQCRAARRFLAATGYREAF